MGSLLQTHNLNTRKISSGLKLMDLENFHEYLDKIF